MTGAEGATYDVEGLAQLARGRLDSQPGPEEVHDPFAVEAVPAREGEQLEEGGRLPEGPGSLLDGAGPDGGAEAAEQPDPYGVLDRGLRRPVLYLGRWSTPFSHPHADLDRSAVSPAPPPF
jgi:hypothetical protein